MKSCVLDTNIVSFTLREAPEALLYKEHLNQSRVILCFQTVAELRYGAVWSMWGNKKRLELENFFKRQTIVSYSSDLADCWALVMNEARLAGRRLESGDAWIAATALLLNIPLLTHDKDFDKTACPSINVISFV